MGIFGRRSEQSGSAYDKEARQAALALQQDIVSRQLQAEAARRAAEEAQIIADSNRDSLLNELREKEKSLKHGIPISELEGD